MPNQQARMSENSHKTSISFSPRSSISQSTIPESLISPPHFSCLFFCLSRILCLTKQSSSATKLRWSFPSHQCPSSTDSKPSLMLLLGTAGHMGTPGFHPGPTRMWYGAFRWWIGIGVVLLTRMSCSKLFLLRTRGFLSGLSASSCFSSRIPTTR